MLFFYAWKENTMNKKEKKRAYKNKQLKKNIDVNLTTEEAYPFLAAIEESMASKDMDQIQEAIMGMFTLYGVTTLEVAQLCFSLFWNTLQQPHNQSHIKDMFDIEPSKLSIDDTLLVQQMLIESSVKKNE